MKRHPDLWVGALVVIALVAALAVLLPSRARLLLARTKPVPERRMTWIEVPAVPPARPAAVVPPVATTPVVTTPVAPAEPSRARPSTPPPDARPAAATTRAEPRFTLDFGTFADVKEIEDAERRLKAAGVDTVRYDDTATVSVYTLKVGQFSSADEAAEGLRALKARYPSVPLGRVELESEQRVTIVAETSHVLRDAVALAEKLRRDGVPVRLQTSATDRAIVGLRLKGGYDADTTRAKERALARRGFPSSVVRAAQEPSW